jgi:hypothetical protein
MSAAGARYGLIAGVTLTVDVPLCVLSVAARPLWAGNLLRGNPGRRRGAIGGGRK